MSEHPLVFYQEKRLKRIIVVYEKDPQAQSHSSVFLEVKVFTKPRSSIS
jgi:hypothetical protein